MNDELKPCELPLFKRVIHRIKSKMLYRGLIRIIKECEQIIEKYDDRNKANDIMGESA